jgi:PilZ domain-containing protein
MKLAYQFALDARYTPEPYLTEFAMRSDNRMESETVRRAKESGVRDRRYSIRHPLAADAEVLELKTGSRSSGVTSDVSLGGCFVCTRRTIEVGARVRGTLTREGQKVKMLAVVRIVKRQVGMGLEFLDIDLESKATLLGWIEKLRKSR